MIYNFLPPQSEVIEKILRYCGLWKASEPRGPPDPVDMDHDPDSVLLDCDAELTVVDIDTFLVSGVVPSFP